MLRPGVQIGPYILTDKIGRGSFGVVWLAEKRTALATTKVALKIPLDDELDLEEIKQEAALWARASGHPNIIPIIEANIYDDQIVIVSEYAPEGSLQEWLKRHGGAAPSMDAAIRVMLGILDGLEHLHTQQIIHRDLKPANLLLQGQTPRIADFGISRVLKTTSQSITIAGTTAYMAPEAFDGKRNEQTDLWAAGVIFYQMITGRLPFPQKDITSLMGAILSRPPDPMPLSVSNHLQAVIARSLDKDIKRRFKSAAEMRVALLFALKQDSQVLHTPLPDRKYSLDTQPDRKIETDVQTKRDTHQVLPHQVLPHQARFEKTRLLRRLKTLTWLVWAQMIMTLISFIVAAIDIESIVLSGLILCILGLVTMISGIRCSLLRSGISGLLIFPASLLCSALIVVNEWSPHEAQEPITILFFGYLILILSLGIASLFGIRKKRKRIYAQLENALQRSAAS
jgi:serine/threonine protein kinase